MNFILEALNHTPWWVFVIFGYLLVISIQASKPRIISLSTLFIFPVLFTLLSLYTLISSFQVSFLSVSIWLVSILIGVGVGAWQISLWQIEVDKKKHLLRVPGTWSTLVIILIIFSAQYYFHYQLTVDPQRVNDSFFEISMLFVSGVCTGLFVGRLLAYLYRYKNNPHTTLEKS